ncbi:integrase, partial [Enterococcus faecium]
MDFETLFKEYLLDLKLKNFSKRTLESYNFQKNKFIRFYQKEINT